MSLTIQQEPRTGACFVVRDGMPMANDDKHWQAVSWIVNGHTVRSSDNVINRFVIFPDKETAELAVWAIQEHEQFVTKLSKRVLPEAHLNAV